MLLNAAMAQKHQTDGPINAGAGNARCNADYESDDFSAMICAIAKSKDKDAFIALFEHFAPRIKSFLMKGGASPEHADELAQETMLTIWNKAESYKPEQAAASTWIFTIARNKRIDTLRKTKRHDIDPADPMILEDTSPSPRANALYQEEVGVLAEALKTLPKEQADLIRMSFFDDKSHAAIAEETGIPLGTVKSRIRLALERLRGHSKVQDIRE